MLTSALIALAVALPAAAARPVLTADFAGDGRSETATAKPRGKVVRLEIADAAGKRLVAEDAPAPAGSGEPVIRLSGGKLGSPGSLLEVSVVRADSECRSIWRFHGGTLKRLPVRRGSEALPDCAQPEGWTVRWDKKSADAPAVWVRERVRETPRGVLTEREVFAFTGFALELDVNRSSAEIGAAAIPAWNDAVLYPRTALEILASRFDLSGFRSAPRLRIKTDRAGGIFELRFRDPAGSVVAPVMATGAGAEENEVRLTVRTEKDPTTVRVTVKSGIVSEVRVSGLSARWDALYLPASRLIGGSLQIYARAEDEIAANNLVGLWSAEKGEQFALNLVPGALGVLEMRRSQVEVWLESVPAGTDVLLVPRDGSPPAWALALKGGNGLERVPVKCRGRDAGAWSCEAAGPAEAFHRVGGRMNAR